MRILLLMSIPYLRKYVGAVRSNRALAEALAQRGHEVCVVTPLTAPPNPQPYRQVLRELEAQGVSMMLMDDVCVLDMNEVEVYAVMDMTKTDKLNACLTQQMQAFQPDWTLVSTEDPGLGLLEMALHVAPERVIYVALTPPMLPFGPASINPTGSKLDLLGKATGISALSQFLADYIFEWTGLPAFVYHPPHFGQGPFPNLANFDQGYVLMINACTLKGLAIFVALAQAMPDVQFAALPGWGTTQADRAMLDALPNMTLLQNRENLEDILCQAKILLMPSLWLEGFGMTVVDTMLRGIPVLASNHSGLVEAKLGTDYLLPARLIEGFDEQVDENFMPVPIVPEQDIQPWHDALRALLADRDLYEYQSQACYKAAGTFVSQLSVEPLEEILNGLAS